jgi:chloramphenicol-sensitive protein RarD
VRTRAQDGAESRISNSKIRVSHFALRSPAVIQQLPVVENQRTGVMAAVAAFFLWGVLPVFWKHLDFLPPASIVAQRTLWSLLILLIILAWRREGRSLMAGMRNPRAAGWQLLSGTLLAANWLLYVWATLNGRILEGALGYYLNPFFNMLFGVLWFGERHNRLQLAAIALALCGVLLQIPAVGRFPWVALTLAVTFSLYGVVKKRSPLASRLGLTAETSLLAPIALAWLVMNAASPAAAFGGSWTHAALVVGSGFATTLPLIFFGHAARNISLTSLGILQFLGPTLQFVIGWKLYGEQMTGPRLISFALIWLAVGIYAADALRTKNRKSGS